MPPPTLLSETAPLSTPLSAQLEPVSTPTNDSTAMVKVVVPVPQTFWPPMLCTASTFLAAGAAYAVDVADETKVAEREGLIADDDVPAWHRHVVGGVTEQRRGG